MADRPKKPELPVNRIPNESKKLTEAEVNALPPKVREWLFNIEDGMPELTAEELRGIVARWVQQQR